MFRRFWQPTIRVPGRIGVLQSMSVPTSSWISAKSTQQLFPDWAPEPRHSAEGFTFRWVRSNFPLACRQVGIPNRYLAMDLEFQVHFVSTTGLSSRTTARLTLMATQ